jgi:hypothetical protein
MASITLTALRWIHEQLYALNSAFETRKSGCGRSQLGNDNTADYQSVVNPNITKGLKREIGDAIIETEIWNPFKIKEGRNGTCSLREGYWSGWQSTCGLIGHDGTPWFWDANKECWVPVAASSLAAAYADSRRAPPPQRPARAPARPGPPPERAMSAAVIIGLGALAVTSSGVGTGRSTMLRS